MLVWLKKNFSTIIAGLALVSFLLYAYSCEPKVASLFDRTRKVNRQEFQLELDQLMGLAQLRMLDFERYDQFRAIVLQNAILLVQGQPLNPFGIITAIAGIYGIKQAGCNITKVVKAKHNKRKENNGTT